jgi:hypothetical protein
VPSPQATQTPAPITTVTRNINAVLNQVSDLISELITPKPVTSAAAKPNPEPSNSANAEPGIKVTKSEVADPPTSLVTTEKPDGTKDVVNAATRTVENVASEKISGFAAGAGLRIEVIGSRITGQFVVAPGDAPDPVTIAAAIQESTARQKTSFASIDSVVRVIPPAANEIFNTPISSAQEEIFKASGLAKPQALGSLNVSKATKWIQVDASAKTYLPGTVVYLTVTTQPIIFGEALVDKFGKASLKGALPIDLLAAGGHSIRIVGVRALEGVSTDGNGEIVLSEAAINEIKKFDDGTKATVIMSGASESGGAQTVVREVPLDRIIPWWTVWLALIVGLLALAARFIRRPVGQKRRIALIVVSFAAGLPAGILGWLNVVYEVWIGLGIAVVFTIVQIFWGRKKRNR